MNLYSNPGKHTDLTQHMDAPSRAWKDGYLGTERRSSAFPAPTIMERLFVNPSPMFSRADLGITN